MAQRGAKNLADLRFGRRLTCLISQAAGYQAGNLTLGCAKTGYFHLSYALGRNIGRADTNHIRTVALVPYCHLADIDSGAENVRSWG